MPKQKLCSSKTAGYIIMYFFFVFQVMLGGTYKPLLCWLHYIQVMYRAIHGNLSCECD